MTESIAAPDISGVYDAFIQGDIAYLEALALETDFPLGDGYLGRTWLTMAIQSNNTEAVAWVLSKSPDVNYKDDEGMTPLRTALEREDSTFFEMGPTGELERVERDGTARTITLIDLLLDAGADINFGGTLGETPLHKAAILSSLEVVRHLLDRGADPTAWDDEYEPRQPAYYAKVFKRWEVYDLLLSAASEAETNS